MEEAHRQCAYVLNLCQKLKNKAIVLLYDAHEMDTLLFVGRPSNSSSSNKKKK